MYLCHLGGRSVSRDMNRAGSAGDGEWAGAVPATERQSDAVAVPRDASRLRNVGELFLVTV